MRDTAAERAASTDWIMRDVAHDGSKQSTHLSVHGRTMECRVAHDGADAKIILDPRHPRELGDPVDVNEMSRPRHPEGHDRNETLSAREYAPVLRTKLGEHRHSLIDRSGDVTNERCGLHQSDFVARLRGCDDMLTMSLPWSQRERDPRSRMLLDDASANRDAFVQERSSFRSSTLRASTRPPRMTTRGGCCSRSTCCQVGAARIFRSARQPGS